MKDQATQAKSDHGSDTLTQAAGPQGASAPPPGYGIDFLDRPRQPNRNGLPDQLKAGIETLSGLGMDDVRVHYHSDKPAQLQALAYTQGTDIYVGPGQERHLPHEAWHVVQQKEGRVKPTLPARKVPVNGDAALEREADAMGAKALEAQNGAPPAGKTPLTAANQPIQFAGKKAHIIGGAVIGSLIPVIGTIIGGYIGYRMHRYKQARAQREGGNQPQVVPPPPPVVEEVLGNKSQQELEKMEAETERMQIVPEMSDFGEKENGKSPQFSDQKFAFEDKEVKRPPKKADNTSGSRTKDLLSFITRMRDSILDGKYKDAYEGLIDPEKADLFGIKLKFSQEIAKNMTTKEATIRGFAKPNQCSTSQPIEITLVEYIELPGKPQNFQFWHDADLAEAILPMYLEEYMHAYQVMTTSLLSERTMLFVKDYEAHPEKYARSLKESNSTEPKVVPKKIRPTKGGNIETGVNYKEVDILATFNEWGFDVEKINYIKRYIDRINYWFYETGKWVE